MTRSPEYRFVHLAELEKRAQRHLDLAVENGSQHSAKRAVRLWELAALKANNSVPASLAPLTGYAR